MSIHTQINKSNQFLLKTLKYNINKPVVDSLKVVFVIDALFPIDLFAPNAISYRLTPTSQNKKKKKKGGDNHEEFDCASLTKSLTCFKCADTGEGSLF
jgi:hypothetical protein